MNILNNKKYFFTEKFGPYSVGHSLKSDGYFCHYGRISKIVFGLDRDNAEELIAFSDVVLSVRNWINIEWHNKILMKSNNKDVIGVSTITVNKLPVGYDSSTESSCKYLFNNIQPMLTNISKGNMWIEHIELWDYDNTKVTHSEFRNNLSTTNIA